MEFLSVFCCRPVLPKVAITLANSPNSGQNVGRVEFDIRLKEGRIEDRDFLYRAVGDLKSGLRIPKRLEEIRITNVLVIHRESQSKAVGFSSYRPRSHGIYQVFYLRLESDGRLSRLGQSPLYNIVETSLFKTYDQRFKVYTCGSCEDFNFSDDTAELDENVMSSLDGLTLCQKPRDFRTRDRQTTTGFDTNSTALSSTADASGSMENQTKLFGNLFENRSDRNDEDDDESLMTDELNDTLPLHDLSDVEEKHTPGAFPLAYPQDKHDNQKVDDNSKDLEDTQKNLKRVLQASDYFFQFEFELCTKPIVTEDDDRYSDGGDDQDIGVVPSARSDDKASESVTTTATNSGEVRIREDKLCDEQLEFYPGSSETDSGDPNHKKTPIENVITSNTGMKTLSHNINIFRCPSRLFTVDEVTSIGQTSANCDLETISNRF